MDIASLSPTLSAIKTNSDFGVAMLSKSLDTSEQMGKSMVDMMDAAALERTVNPSVGSNIDYRV